MRRIAVVNPATERTIAWVGGSSSADVVAAVASADKCSELWASSGVDLRAKTLHKIADAIERRGEEIVNTLVADVGVPIRLARRAHLEWSVRALRSFANILPQYSFETYVGNSRVIKQPVGVIAAITPANYPLNQVVVKIAAALAAGSTVVAKPSPMTPLVIEHLADALREADVPTGVVNFVHASRRGTHELIRHEDIGLVSFTGSTSAGRKVARLAAGELKPTVMELGGKSAMIVLPGADPARVEAAVTKGVRRAFLNNGQSCNAWSRFLVHRSVYHEVVDLTCALVDQLRVGDPTRDETDIGPLLSRGAREKVLDHIRGGVRDGARLVRGRPNSHAVTDVGYFVQPTVFIDVRPGSRIEQEEIFGPVLCIIPFDTCEEALTIANGTGYGLGAAVWSDDVDEIEEFVHRLRMGQVDVNGGKSNVQAPFGGLGRSGYGREYGAAGIEEFLTTKSIQT